MTLKEISLVIENELFVNNKSPKKKLIAIDGIDAAGKTTFSNKLSKELTLKSISNEVVHLDDFHHPREIRYRQGRDSARGFYEDSYNYEVFVQDTIEPYLKGEEKIKIKHFDLDSNREEPIYIYNSMDLLIVEGIFAHREALRGYWDYSIFLDINFDEGLKRSLYRNAKAVNISQVEYYSQFHLKRYQKGQEIYFLTDNPKSYASMIINNDTFID